MVGLFLCFREGSEGLAQFLGKKFKKRLAFLFRIRYNIKCCYGSSYSVSEYLFKII